MISNGEDALTKIMTGNQETLLWDAKELCQRCECFLSAGDDTYCEDCVEKFRNEVADGIITKILSER